MTTPRPRVPLPGAAARRATTLRGRTGWPALALVLAVAAAPSCGGKQGNARSGPPPVPVAVAAVETRTMPVSFPAIGTVEPIATVAVTARVGGELQKVSFVEGQHVAAGAPLLTIDPRPYQAALAQAEANLARDRALLAKAEADITRYASLVKQDFVTREQYDQITASAGALRASLAAGQAAVDSARLNLAYCTIDAPISGRTGNLMVKAGNLIRANDDRSLVTVNQMRPIYVAFAVPAQLLPDLRRRPLDLVKVVATLPQAGERFEGTLSFVDNSIDTATGTLLLKATFANETEGLWPGQFVDVEVILGEEAGRLVVPQSAVQTSQQGQFVFVVTAEGTAELRPVKVARADDRQAVIAEGLRGGETVVTDGHLRLVPGSRVQAAAPAGERRP